MDGFAPIVLAFTLVLAVVRGWQIFHYLVTS